MEIYSTCFGKSSDLLSIGNLHEKLKYLLLDGASEKMLQNWIYELHPSHIHWLNELIPFTSTPGKKLATSVRRNYHSHQAESHPDSCPCILLAFPVLMPGELCLF